MKSSLFAAVAIITCSVLCLSPFSASAAEKEKKQPATIYWMSAATANSGMPGMPDAGSMFGGMLGGKGSSGGTQKTLMLQLNSPRPLPDTPEATHDIPPGQNMGKTLPLVIPQQVKTRHAESPDDTPPMEKPKVRMLIYWGCGEVVGKGQPRVLDTATMSMEEFGRAMRSRTGSAQYPPMPRQGWMYADWPNRENNTRVPADSSLRGDHFIHGNYVPDMKFMVGEKYDFMAPVEFSAVKGGLSDAMTFSWRGIPTAIGYFAVAMAHNEKGGEMIIWTSSEVSDMGFGLMNYLPSADVRKFIKEKVIMPQGKTACTVPKGIFSATGGAMLQFIAYGEDYWAGYPPRPKDPRQPWNPIWQTKLRLKSTGMLPLGMGDMSSDKQETPRQEKQEKTEDGSPVKVLRGLFGL